jgi:hypothetical protein
MRTDQDGLLGYGNMTLVYHRPGSILDLGILKLFCFHYFLRFYQFSSSFWPEKKVTFFWGSGRALRRDKEH